MAIVLKESISINPIESRSNHIVEHAYQYGGNGHYCTVASSDKKRAAQGISYAVELDINYNVTKCHKFVNDQRVSLCPAFEYGSSHRCKHMQQIEDFYASNVAALRDDTENPIVDIIRKNKIGKFVWTKVRESQLSADERRAAYASQFVY